MIEYALAIFLGILAGIITGLLPGIHINLVSAFLISGIGVFSGISPIILVIFIVAMTISHVFFDFLPSIFLGAPDEDSVLSVLPGHELLLKGRGYEAMLLTLYGGLIGIFLSLAFIPLFIFVFPKIYFYLKFVMFFILVFANGYLLFREKSITALIVFMLSGFLGVITLNLPIQNSLLPLLGGLFGASSLITSIAKKSDIPEQKIQQIKINKKEFLNPLYSSIFSAPLCSFLPALGSGQAATIGSDIIKLNRREFLILIGIINAVVAGLSFVTLYSIGKARTGSAVVVQELLDKLNFSDLAVIAVVIIISGIIAFSLAFKMSKIFAKFIQKINYQKLSFWTLIFISVIVIAFSGFIGFLIFLVATFIGLFTIISGVRRTNMMGSLMLPAILLYLPTSL
jgi:putative membrane protein